MNPAAPHAVDRPSRRAELCEWAFQFVDHIGTGYMNMNQNKIGLTMVFEQLGDVPMPKDEWYVRVFRNFVPEDKGLIDFKGFQEIVVQWDDHHLQKRQLNGCKVEAVRAERFVLGAKRNNEDEVRDHSKICAA